MVKLRSKASAMQISSRPTIHHTATNQAKKQESEKLRDCVLPPLLYNYVIMALTDGYPSTTPDGHTSSTSEPCL